MNLLKDLCEIFGPSGDELAVRDYIIEYVRKHSKEWATEPELIFGEDFQNCLILKFGKPRTAIFSHMDSHGFTVRYENQLIPIGSPESETGYTLVGADSKGLIECKLDIDEDKRARYVFGRAIETGTQLVFKCDFKEKIDYIQSSYLDNRLGLYVALTLASELRDGVIVFSCWEEHGGGSVPFLTKFIYEQYRVKQALICDITWVTDGIKPSEGVAISMRDYNIPRKQFIEKIIDLADSSSVPYQLEVEGSGSSDGREIHQSPYPIDWCFIGAPAENVHSPVERVHKKDIESMIDLYSYLLRTL